MKTTEKPTDVVESHGEASEQGRHSARLLSRLFLAHRFFGLVRGGSRVFPGGPRKPPETPRDGPGWPPGAPGARVKKPKNPYFCWAQLCGPEWGLAAGAPQDKAEDLGATCGPDRSTLS